MRGGVAFNGLHNDNVGKKRFLLGQIAVSVNTPIGRAVMSLSKAKYTSGLRGLFKHSKAA